jgi:hypothetical protein
MAARSGGGIANKREDGKTLTQYWCQAFDEFLKLDKPFNSNDIQSSINSNFESEKYPATFVLREGWGVPITFHALPLSSTIPTALATQTVIMVIQIMEGPDSLNPLIEYLEKAPIKITVLATLPIDVPGTLLLLRVPAYLQAMLVLPRVSFILT